MPSYFVKTGGNDASDGLSDANAWATINKANNVTVPGDTINLRGGDTFSDATIFPQTNQTWQSYGTGQAKISRSIPVSKSGASDGAILRNLYLQAALTSAEPVIQTDSAGGAITNWLLDSCTIDGQARGPFTITGATNANPIVVACVAHPFQTGEMVDVFGVLGNTTANGEWTVTRVDADHFSIPVAGNGAYTSGGVCGSGGSGINAKKSSDSGWTLRNCTIKNTGNSGMIAVGDNLTIDGGTIGPNVGFNDGLGTFGKHGVYCKSVGATFKGGLRVTACKDNGISLRKRNARVENVSIDTCSNGIAYFTEDTIVGKTIIDYCTITAYSNAGIYYDPTGNGGTAFDDFVVANCTLDGPGTNDGALDFDGGYKANITIRNNVVANGSSPPTNFYLKARVPNGGKVFLEDHNCWAYASGTKFRWGTNAGSYTSFSFADYATQSGQGVGSIISVVPLFGVAYALLSASPCRDIGTTTVDAALAYIVSPDGAPLHYFGIAPDMGSHEYVGAPVGAMSFASIYNAVAGIRFNTSASEIAQIKQWVNAAEIEVWAAADWIFKRVARASLSVIAGNNAPALPADFSRAIRVYDETGTRLDYRAPDLFEEVFTASAANGTPTSYTVINRQLYLGPTPNANKTFKLSYERRYAHYNSVAAVTAGPMSADTDYPLWDPEFHYLLVPLAIVCGARLENEPAPQGYQDQADRLLAAMVAELVGGVKGEVSPEARNSQGQPQPLAQDSQL